MLSKTVYKTASGPNGTTLYWIYQSTVYGNADGSDPRTTTFYDTYTGSELTQSVETLPPVSDENASGSDDTITTVYDTLGQVSSVTADSERSKPGQPPVFMQLKAA